MNCAAVAWYCASVRIAALHFGNRFRLRHPGRNGEVESIAARVGAMLRLGQALRYQRVLVSLRAQAAGWRKSDRTERLYRVSESCR